MRPWPRVVAVLLFLAPAALAGLAPAARLDAAPSWEEASLARGINFLRAGDDGAEKFLTVVGGGACIGDFDGDGFEDVYLVNQKYYDRARNDRYAPTSRLYANDGDGTFTDVTAGSGVALPRTWGNGCGAADYDADGDLDLYVTAYGASSLFRNEGGFRFANVTAASGASTDGRCPGYPCWSQAALFHDVNGDACLDLYVTNYVKYNDSSARPGENGPSYYDGQGNLYFESRCDGTFLDRTTARNLSGRTGPDGGKSFQAAWLDYDGDGDEDVYVANDEVANDLLRNDGGVFVNVAEGAGVADLKGSMGLDAQDLDGDARPDLYFTQYQYETNGVYTNDGDATFTDRSTTVNLSSSDCCVGWGTAMLDWNADGRVDVLAVNGHTRKVFDDYAEERLLWRRDPGAYAFTLVNDSHGPGVDMKSIARGMAMADLDFNGVLDFVVANTGNSTANLIIGSGGTNGWLQIQLRQDGPNPRGIGARVTVTPAGGAPVTRWHRTSQSFESQHSEFEYFGLGTANDARVDVRWPDGVAESWRIGANKAVRLVRGEATPREDVFSPASSATADAPTTNGWHRVAVNVSIESRDRGVSLVSGLDRIERRLDGGAWATYAGPIRFEEGDRLLEFRGTDVAGNVEPTRALRVRVDATPPTSAADVLDPVAGWATAASRIRLTGSDDRSGLDRVEYRWPHLGSAWATYAAPLTPSGEGRFTLERRAVDAAGNVESVQSQTVAVDAVAPRVAVAWDGPTLNVSGVTHVTSATRLALTAEDAASGVEALEHRVDGGPWTATGASVSFTGADGARVLEWRARDSAGNERRGAIDVYLDNHRPPAIVAHSPQRSTIAFGRIDAAAPDVAGGRTVLLGRVPVTALAGPDVSGNAWTRVLVDNAVRATAPGARVTWTWDALAEPPGEHVLTFEAADGLGNVGRVTVRVVSVPSALP